MPKQNTLRLALTDEQKQAIRTATGKDAEVLELSVEELEDRIAPAKILKRTLG